MIDILRANKATCETLVFSAEWNAKSLKHLTLEFNMSAVFQDQLQESGLILKNYKSKTKYAQFIFVI